MAILGRGSVFFPVPPWISLNSSLGIAVLPPSCLCSNVAPGIVLGVKWVVIHAAGYGGEEECQNIDILGLQFGNACLVSVGHLPSLFSGGNTLLRLGRELGKQASLKIKLCSPCETQISPGLVLVC